MSSKTDYNLISMIITKKFSVLIQAGLALVDLDTLYILAYHTPSGWMGKLQAIGYSVCHQIPSHSFKIGSMTFPLCSRCTGMYLGVCIGVGVLFTQGKKSGFPSVKVFSNFWITHRSLADRWVQLYYEWDPGQSAALHPQQQPAFFNRIGNGSMYCINHLYLVQPDCLAKTG